jgi:hypothetical protein
MDRGTFYLGVKMTWVRSQDGNSYTKGKKVITRNSKTSTKRWEHNGEFFLTLNDAQRFADDGIKKQSPPKYIGSNLTVTYECCGQNVSATINSLSVNAGCSCGCYNDEFSARIYNCSVCDQWHDFRLHDLY